MDLFLDCLDPVDLSRGDVAPCSGLLVNRDQAAEAAKLKLIYYPELQEEYQHALDEWALDVASREDIIKANDDTITKMQKLLDRNLAPPEIPFYETWWFGAGVATVVIAGVAIAIVSVE